MKLKSRPINWSLLLIPMLVSAVAIPGTAYSQQRDRHSTQQEQSNRARGERRSMLKGERVEQHEETARPRPARSGANSATTASRPVPAAVAPPQQIRRAASQSDAGRPEARRPISDAGREPAARAQNTRMQADSQYRQRNGRSNQVRTDQRQVRQDRPQRIAAPLPSSQPQINRGAYERRDADRRPIATPNQNRRPPSPPAARYGQNDRNRGYRDSGSHGNGSQAYRPRQSSGQQEQRIRAERQQADRYFASQARQRDIAAQRARMLQQQRRANQYRYQNQYDQRLRQQYVVWNSNNYDYYRDPFYSTPASYRYQFGGQWQTTNRYGADLMRQAVDHGYQEGLRAGGADRQDGWRADYGNSFAYQDGTYGYNGRYISPAEYQHYFRQGFRRGYQDGYSDRYSYGYRRNDGSYAVVAAVLAAIVGLQLLN